ncbi:MAG: hypothetical protein IJ086_00390 [Clostridium sp.]|nr:hypothetical protein [Clostridium sp.]
MFEINLGKIIVRAVKDANINDSKTVRSITEGYSDSDFISIAKAIIKDEKLFFNLMNSLNIGLTMKDLEVESNELLSNESNNEVIKIIEKNNSIKERLINIGSQAWYYMSDYEEYDYIREAISNDDRDFAIDIAENLEDFEEVEKCLNDYFTGKTDSLSENNMDIFNEVKDAIFNAIEKNFRNYYFNCIENTWLKNISDINSDTDNNPDESISSYHSRLGTGCWIHLCNLDRYNVIERDLDDSEKSKFLTKLGASLKHLDIVIDNLNKYSNCEIDDISDEAYEDLSNAADIAIKSCFSKYYFDNEVECWCRNIDNEAKLGTLALEYIYFTGSPLYSNILKKDMDSLKDISYIIWNNISNDNKPFIKNCLLNKELINDDNAGDVWDILEAAVDKAVIEKLGYQRLYDDVWAKQSSDIVFNFATKLEVKFNHETEDCKIFDISCNIPYINKRGEYKFTDTLEYKYDISTKEFYLSSSYIDSILGITLDELNAKVYSLCKAYI